MNNCKTIFVGGVLVCDGKPAANVKVKLYDDDRGKIFKIIKIFKVSTPTIYWQN